ncbi:hypothetical protein M1116_02835 [Patescibacteria group bacterium]|nr:hypothetical protein [Patescibacteria group bacterium]
MFSRRYLIAILFIWLAAFLFRIHGLNWDQGNHLHPDERFLTMVSTDIRLPHSLSNYLDTATSPLNPYNYKQYQFFVYGTFPIFFTKYIATFLHQDGYDQIYLVGRVLSAIFDSFNIFLLFILSLKIFPRKSKFIFLPSLLYTFCVLPLQLSHFFAVDTFLTFFLLLTFILLNSRQYLFASFVFGLALTSKISAVYFAPIFALFLVINFFQKRTFKALILVPFSCLFLTFLAFRFFQPYAFVGLLKLNPLFISNLKELAVESGPQSFFPPAVQWFSKIRFLFPFQNLVIWGLGLPLTLAILITSLQLKKHWRHLPLVIIASTIWILGLLLYQGSQFASTMRYLLPIYPFIILVAAYLIFLSRSTKVVALILVFHGLFGLMFLGIYSRPHSRYQASLWMYQHIPPNSRVSNEYWDDILPINVPGYNPSVYQGVTLSFYDTESPVKWQHLSSQLQDVDYLVMSSNRLWASIPQLPSKYPDTTKFYNQLFDEKTQFKKILEVNSYPGIMLPFLRRCYYFGPTNFPYQEKTNRWFTVDSQCFYPGIYFRDDTAEEAFTVYDHPKVLIFKNSSI